MNKLLLLIIVAMFSYWGWENQAKLAGHWKDLEARITGIFAARTKIPEETAPVAEVEPPVEVPADTPIAPPPPPALIPTESTLPEGVYYTRERISETTELGVRSISHGIKVQKTGESGGKIVVTDGRATVATDLSNLTNEIAEVRALQGAIAAQEIATIKTEKRSTPAAGAIRSPSSRKAKTVDPVALAAVQNQLNTVELQYQNLRSELSRLAAKESSARLRGKTSSYGANISRVEAQIAAVEAQKNALTAKLINMR